MEHCFIKGFRNPSLDVILFCLLVSLFSFSSMNLIFKL